MLINKMSLNCTESNYRLGPAILLVTSRTAEIHCLEKSTVQKHKPSRVGG